MKTVNVAIIGCILVSVALFSCDDQAEKMASEEVRPSTVAQTALSSPPLAGQDTAVPSVVAKVSPVNAPTTVKPSPSKAALNPKHGEPGHRCDIPVGAPLDSKPVSATTTTQPATPVKPVTPVMPSAAVGAVNPKHGEPGHRCDIPVGAPLNSAPSKPATNVSAPAVPNTSASQPATSLNSNASNLPKLPLRLPGANMPSSSAPDNLKFNPKHGEPGHRCDLAVGAPLK